MVQLLLFSFSEFIFLLLSPLTSISYILIHNYVINITFEIHLSSFVLTFVRCFKLAETTETLIKINEKQRIK